MQLKEVFHFLKNPVYQEDGNTDFKYRIRVFRYLLMYSLLFSFMLGVLVLLLERGFALDLGQHAMDAFLSKYPPLFLLFVAVFLAPLMEEVFFRGPLIFFKGHRSFPKLFYLITLLFGFVHLLNFRLNTTTLLLSPILVAPQLSAGLFFGFIRVRFGLLWSIGLHACYNFILIGPVLAFHLIESAAR
jgi:membrane protease YdiL (CAAX protease family)